MPKPQLSPAIARQLDLTEQTARARYTDEQTRRAAAMLAADLDDLRAVVAAIAENGISTGRQIEVESHAAHTADTLALFFATFQQSRL